MINATSNGKLHLIFRYIYKSYEYIFDNIYFIIIDFAKVINSLSFQIIKCNNWGIINSRGEQLCNETLLDIECSNKI